VKPPPFAYHAPDSVGEAVDLLASHEDSRVLAGGQSLMQMMKFRTVKPALVVDINRIGELETIDRANDGLSLGAIVRQQRLIDDPVLAEDWPLLAKAARNVGYRETRRRGTIGGSLAFAAPWAELTAAVIALDGEIDMRSVDGERTIRADAFFEGPNQTALSPNELIVRVRLPAAAERRGTGFYEVSARYRDYAQVAAAAVVTESGQARLVLLCVARTPRLIDAGSVLADGGSAVDQDALAALLNDLDPLDDVEATAAFRRRVAPVVARRALEDAYLALERTAA
jgi:carbon-monoxide dehydrogenase medium subunit